MLREVRTKQRISPKERRRLILDEVLAGDGRVAGLSARFDVSESTIRRDLHSLTKEGHVARTYGGAILNPRAVESSLDEKQLRNFREKDAIAARAADLVQDSDVVILDAGTTTGRLAWYLRDRADLTVITNAVNVLHTLSAAGGPEVVVLGGGLRRINQALLGGIAESNLSRLRADRVFLGAEGISARGISCPTMAQSYLKELMIEHADEVYVLADHSKLSATPFAYCAELDRPYTLVTDSLVPAERVREFERIDLASLLVADVSERGVARA
ncbi:MAG TPA: DeoR/GlpR family DNA-binding transcription regulator [Actinomycetota bacterium]